MNLIKRLMPLIAAMAMAFSASAALQYVVVNEGQDQSTVFALEDKPTVTFISNQLVISAGDKTISLPMTEKVSFTFSEDATGVEEILAQPNSVALCWNGQSIDLTGLKPLSKVSLYQVDGKMLKSATCDRDGRITLDVDSYNGVIIISTETKAFKIAK